MRVTRRVLLASLVAPVVAAPVVATVEQRLTVAVGFPVEGFAVGDLVDVSEFWPGEKREFTVLKLRPFTLVSRSAPLYLRFVR